MRPPEKTEFVGQILTLRNVSDFKKLDQVKSNFLATVSHELKTPLSSINLNTKLLQDERLPADERLRITGYIRQETQRLQRMVGELLDVSRLDAGAGIQLDVQPTDLADVVGFATATVQPQLADKNLRLDLQLPADLPAARADVEKTTWVLINLLANAIRYSPLGEALTVRAAMAGAFVQVSVQDRGPGIAAEHHDKIFQRFAQLPDKSRLPRRLGPGPEHCPRVHHHAGRAAVGRERAGQRQHVQLYAAGGRVAPATVRRLPVTSTAASNLVPAAAQAARNAEGER